MIQIYTFEKKAFANNAYLKITIQCHTNEKKESPR